MHPSHGPCIPSQHVQTAWQFVWQIESGLARSMPAWNWIACRRQSANFHTVAQASLFARQGCADYVFTHSVDLFGEPVTRDRLDSAIARMTNMGFTPTAYSIMEGHCCVTAIQCLAEFLELRGVPWSITRGARFA